MELPQSTRFQSNKFQTVAEPISDCCVARLTTHPHRDRCHLPPRQQCSNCEAVLCDLHAEFCAICLAFFCEGCLDLHNEDGQHADGNIGEIVAIVREGVQR